MLAIAGLTALGFCVAFAVEQILREAGEAVARRVVVEKVVERSVVGDETGAGALVDGALGESGPGGALRLEAAMKGRSLEGQEEVFLELMARDLEGGRVMGHAGLALREIARRDPARAVGLLYALRPGEREALAVSMVSGWVESDVAGAFGWIEGGWTDPEGNFVDRGLQNELWRRGIETLVAEQGRYGEAIALAEGVVDPTLRAELVGILARNIALEGPEAALARLELSSSDALDGAIMDAVALEWAARDGEGALRWTLANEDEVSVSGVRGIAKQLSLGGATDGLRSFHGGLRTEPRREAVAAEAARLQARRDPVAAADWVLAIGRPAAKRDAALGALREMGYDSFGQSVDFVELVFERTEAERVPVLHATLMDWARVDRASVVEYLISERAGLPDAVSEQILLAQ